MSPIRKFLDTVTVHVKLDHQNAWQLFALCIFLVPITLFLLKQILLVCTCCDVLVTFLPLLIS